MKINTLIIDDDPLWRDLLERFAKMNSLIHLVDSFDSALKAYAKVSEGEIDLLLLDVDMPELSGIDFVKSLERPPFVIFITAHSKYALDSYDVSAVDYLVKPFTYDRFLKAIERVRERLLVKQRLKSSENPVIEQDYFFIRVNQNYLRFLYDDVLYMKAQENFTQIFTKDNSEMALVNIRNIEKQLLNDVFVRVHRSYLVNRKAITMLTKDHVLLINGLEIPIGKQYKQNVESDLVQSKLIKRIVDN